MVALFYSVIITELLISSLVLHQSLDLLFYTWCLGAELEKLLNYFQGSPFWEGWHLSSGDFLCCCLELTNLNHESTNNTNYIFFASVLLVCSK